jgi:hypothetical protein
MDLSIIADTGFICVLIPVLIKYLCRIDEMKVSPLVRFSEKCIQSRVGRGQYSRNSKNEDACGMGQVRNVSIGKE